MRPKCRSRGVTLIDEGWLFRVPVFDNLFSETIFWMIARPRIAVEKFCEQSVRITVSLKITRSYGIRPDAEDLDSMRTSDVCLKAALLIWSLLYYPLL